MADDEPQPGLYHGPEGQTGPAAFTLDVDGEQFVVHPSSDDGAAYYYDWLSGPNRGYGFSSSGPPNPTLARHRDAIRGFLSMIDPNTGYIADD